MILEEIVADTRAIVAERKASQPEEMLRERLEKASPTLDFLGALLEGACRPGVSIIAEIKRASPSRGALNLGLEPAQLAVVYASAGAAAISVLTEPSHFRGRPEDLSEARRGLAEAGLSCPLLRKDFIIDPYQLIESRLIGADAILLIVAALSDALLAELLQGALDLGLTPLVEVHDERELARISPLHPPLIGINNRNLLDFSVDLRVTHRLRPLIPADCIVVSESGIHEPEQMRELAALRVDAALVGEALVVSKDPAACLLTLKAAGR
jgi:indole-3-glycerol phosphate synthase